MDKAELYRAATLLLDDHGPHIAWQRALQRAADCSDDAGRVDWGRVADIIDKLTQALPQREGPIT